MVSVAVIFLLTITNAFSQNLISKMSKTNIINLSLILNSRVIFYTSHNILNQLLKTYKNQCLMMLNNKTVYVKVHKT